jgi:hypothetical protein
VKKRILIINANTAKPRDPIGKINRMSPVALAARRGGPVGGS